MNKSMNKFVGSFILSLGIAVSVTAQAEDLLLAVSEGTSGGLDAAQVIAKYKDLADVLARTTKTKVNVVFVRDFETLEDGLKTNKFTFAFARPSDYPARAMRDHGYSYVANAKPDGQCYIVVKKDSSLQTLADIKNKKIAMPEKVAYMSKFCAAELRTKGIDLEKEKVTYVKEQAAVAFYLDNNLAEVGAIASYSGVGKGWEKKGNRILHKSIPQPYFPLVANSKVRSDQIKEVQKNLVGLTASPQGQEILKRIGIDGFDIGGDAKMKELPKWLGQ